jgi:predicted glutamine amidotransferase
MCRLFGFRSILLSGVHSSLVTADNALMNLSQFHPDGWGVSYYINNTPHLIRSTQSAVESNLFKQISGVVTSQTVIAHIRKATEGSISILNTHPFQFGKWTFAHNGNIKDFQNYKDELKALIDPNLAKYILGSTDSEILFFILLTEIDKVSPYKLGNITTQALRKALVSGLRAINKIIGPLTNEEQGRPTQNYLTFIITNGKIMYGHQGGQPLYYSTHKFSCPENKTCSQFNSSCEKPHEVGSPVNHLLFSSVPLQGENVWLKMTPGQVIGIDENFKIEYDDSDLEFD